MPRYPILRHHTNVGFFPHVHFSFYLEDEIEGIHVEVESSHARLINFKPTSSRDPRPIFNNEGKKLTEGVDDLETVLRGIGQYIMYIFNLMHVFLFSPHASRKLPKLTFHRIFTTWSLYMCFDTRFTVMDSKITGK